jgi:hypothetical protein
MIKFIFKIIFIEKYIKIIFFLFIKIYFLKYHHIQIKKSKAFKKVVWIQGQTPSATLNPDLGFVV